MTAPQYILEGFRPHGPGQCRCSKCGAVVSTNAFARSKHVCEGAIMREFLTGPLTLAQAIGRLVSIGYLREDAEDLVNEWADEGEATRGHQ